LSFSAKTANSNLPPPKKGSVASVHNYAAAALEALRAGLVYQGPSLLHAIHSGLAQLLAQRGARSLAALVAA